MLSRRTLLDNARNGKSRKTLKGEFGELPIEIPRDRAGRAAYPPIAQSWRNNWARVIPFFDYPPEIRRIIYTTNAIESVNMSLRKVTKSRGSFPKDEAVLKLFYLALINISKKWTMPLHEWKPALNRFAIQFEGRMPQQ